MNGNIMAHPEAYGNKSSCPARALWAKEKPSLARGLECINAALIYCTSY